MTNDLTWEYENTQRTSATIAEWEVTIYQTPNAEYRPMVRWTGADLPTQEDAQAALERLLRHDLVSEAGR